MFRARREYSNTEIKEDNIGRKQVSRMSNKVLPPVDSIFTYDKDLIRNLAEASFLFGEVSNACVYFHGFYLCQLML